MTKKPDGGSAFPIDTTFSSSRGMTLRDYFAGQALAGWLASFGEDSALENMSGISELMYAQADAMIAERDK